MRVKLFTLRYSATLGGFDDTPLQQYTRDKELLAFREHFYRVSDVPHMTCVLLSQDAVIAAADLAAARQDGASPRAAPGDPAGRGAPGTIVAPADWAPPAEKPARRRGARQGRGHGAPDPTAGLTEPERVLFNTLREWRLATAREEGVPPFLIFTNKHLLQIIAARPSSPNALQQIAGIGPGKVQRYGEALLALLHGSPGEAAADAGTASTPLAAPAEPTESTAPAESTPPTAPADTEPAPATAEAAP